MRTPEFYLVLKDDDLHDELADAVYEAGFDDSCFTMRGGNAAIWVRHRPGEFVQVVRHALDQARQGGLSVSHVEAECDAFL
jgi:hypothetical protein